MVYKYIAAAVVKDYAKSLGATLILRMCKVIFYTGYFVYLSHDFCTFLLFLQMLRCFS